MIGKLRSPTYAEIDLSAVADNVRAIRSRVGAGVRVIAAVKANAYGHGAVEVSRACLSAGASMLGVACLDEAIELRDAGIASDILILGCQPAEAAADIVETGAVATVCDIRFAKALSDAAIRQNKPARVHLKVDTGMGRIGVWPEDAAQTARSVRALPGLRLEGVYTHYACADVPGHEFTRRQFEAFREVVQQLEQLGMNPLVAHASNSGAIISMPESNFGAVRPGIALYGVYPSQSCPRDIRLREALTLKSRIVFLKKTPRGASVSYGRTHITKRNSVIATIPIGYADGYSRFLSNAGEAVVRGTRVPVVGRVCMDQTMLDVTEAADVAVGDEVTIYGGGYDFLSVSHIAEKIGTIPYELLCCIGRRVQRVYSGREHR